MSKLLSFLLLIGAVALAYLGFTTYQEATADVSFLGLDLSLSDQEAKQTAIYYFVGAGACLLGAFAFSRKS